jgi:hypothetical protein
MAKLGVRLSNRYGRMLHRESCEAEFRAMPEQMQLVKQFSGGTVANIEKHQKQPMEQIVDAGSSGDPTRACASHLIGRYISNEQNDCRVQFYGREDRGQPVILRLENLPATPHNFKRIHERVRLLNQQLAASGMPFRLRVV